ncbi:MAG: DUF3426 domain-containing protein [Lysobacteraceae bacterium]
MTTEPSGDGDTDSSEADAEAWAEAEADVTPIDQGELFGVPLRSRSTPLPGFARQRVRLPRPRQLKWWLVGIALLIALLALIPIADRAQLATNPRWRPSLQSLCDTVHCSLPPWRELPAFEVTSRDVRPHPSVANALLITASFRNNARFAQDWPLLELRMSDLNGRDIGMRRFRVHEYLGAAPPTPLIASGQRADAVLEVVDPGHDAVAFAFDFR